MFYKNNTIIFIYNNFFSSSTSSSSSSNLCEVLSFSFPTCIALLKNYHKFLNSVISEELLIDFTIILCLYFNIYPHKFFSRRCDFIRFKHVCKRVIAKIFLITLFNFQIPNPDLPIPFFPFMLQHDIVYIPHSAFISQYETRYLFFIIFYTLICLSI